MKNFITQQFKKGQELQKMVVAFGKLTLMLDELKSKFEMKNDNLGHKDEIFIVAYAFRREILLRLEQYEFALSTLLIIPGLPKRVVLHKILMETNIKIQTLARAIKLEEIVEEIMEGGQSYIELDKALQKYDMIA